MLGKNGKTCPAEISLLEKRAMNNNQEGAEGIWARKANFGCIFRRPPLLAVASYLY
jgi:hypothetical protein